jgi:hypothetical protein
VPSKHKVAGSSPAGGTCVAAAAPWLVALEGVRVMLADKPWSCGFRTASAALVSLVAFTILSSGCLALPTPTLVSPLAPSSVSKGPVGLTIVHSNDTWGYLEPCG